MSTKTMNVLLCIDDIKGDYTRHCAVTILSLLETNKNNNIKIWIMSSILSQENIDELKRIVHSYKQKIDFIICDNIIPEELKQVMINTNNLTWGVWYRRFFPNFIKGIDRLLCIDCDVLVLKDISKIYNMDMHGKMIAGYCEPEPSKTIRESYFGLDHYINNGVLLFDAKKYDVKKISVNKLIELNNIYKKYWQGSDQDKTNIIYKDDIFVYSDKGMNYTIERPFFNKGIEKATFLHVLAKPYFEWSLAPKNVCELYNYYLSKTKRKNYPKTKKILPLFGYIWNCSYRLVILLLSVFGKKIPAYYSIGRTKISTRIYNYLKKTKSLLG